MSSATVRGPYASINTISTHLSFRWTLPLNGSHKKKNIIRLNIRRPSLYEYTRHCKIRKIL
jgi:hypothetical protein